jgi:hypothetical protein
MRCRAKFSTMYDHAKLEVPYTQQCKQAKSMKKKTDKYK